MVRKINKIMALVLIAASIFSTTSVALSNKIANAAENSVSTTLANPTDEQIFYAIKSRLDIMYAQLNCVVESSSTPVRSIPLVISNDVATQIASSTVTDSLVKDQIKAQKIEEYKTENNTNTVPLEVVAYINNQVENMTKSQLDAAKQTVIQSVVTQLQSLNGQSIPVYAYKAIDKSDMTTVKDQGYFLGGKVGYMLMQKSGKPVMISSSQLDNTVIGKFITEIRSKLADIEKSAIDVATGITNSMNAISDSLDDLTDALEDKNDDVDEAWNKVFDRFDNEPGWGKKDGYIYYYDKDGVSLKGVQKINGKTYYFNKIDGAMEMGWQIVDGKRCYFDKKKGYEVFNKWIEDDGDYYFVGEDGVVKKMEWINVGGKNYYLKADGKMTKDWLKIDDYWYLFNKDGSMVTSTWKWSEGKWYYLKDNGQAAVNWIQLGGKWYHFKDPSGELQTGWFRADGNWYCTNDDGSMKIGWASSKDGICYLDETTGIMKKNEWATIDGKTYYFNINGVMVTGTKYIDGTKYTFNSDGTLS